MRLQRGLQDLLPQVGREPALRPLALRRLPEGLAAPAAKSRAGGQNGGARQPCLLSNGVVGDPLAGQQNHFTLARQALRRGAEPRSRFQLAVFEIHQS